MNTKKLAEEIRALATSDEIDHEGWLKRMQKDWPACKAAADILKETGSEEDAKALVFFANFVFEKEAKAWSHMGDEKDIEYRRKEIAACEKALEINPAHGACLNNQGITYMQLEEWPPAISCFERAIAAPHGYDPEQTSEYYYENVIAKAWANLAASRWNNKDFEGALTAIEEAVKRDSSNKDTQEFMLKRMPYRKVTLG